MDKLDNVLNYMINESYATTHDILYNTKLPFNLTLYELEVLKQKKCEKALKNDNFYMFDLISYNNQPLLFGQSKELQNLINIYSNLIKSDFVDQNSFMAKRNMPEILTSQIYSEVEGTLSIESVCTSHKRIEEIATKKRDPKEKNDYIIQNMIEGLMFVSSKPKFNKENLYHLYQLLSKNCLDDENKLKKGQYYRDDEVEIDNYNGCPYKKIDECMDSLFLYVNKVIASKNAILKFLLPHVVHYYIAYIHPYFDYNGRTARMASFWINCLLPSASVAPTISEAIDQTKSKYYSALRNTRDSGNDLSYFLIYIYKISITYFNCYKNIEEIESSLKNESIVLSTLDKVYIKKIFINSKGMFTWQDFVHWIKIEISKQGALKILNYFVEINVLVEKESKSNTKLFEINQNFLKYKMS